MSESEAKVAPDGTNGFTMPLFGFPKIASGELAEQGVNRAQEGCEKIKAASDEMTGVLREAYSNNARSATDYGLRVIEMSKANTAAGMDFLSQLLASKSMTDVFTLSATQTRKVFEAASAQNKELWELAQKLVAGTGEPVRNHVTKIFHQAS